ncbi:MAG: histidine kinase [Candidatus Parabeggiatoa sp. nov. 3]|nr:MAG: histidine kinase [Gammaproteobacteria bacterium]RKZ85348.1 MAG: histidine kinase [Gammaproteobacteria bacterium]HEW97259.1 response regulator [Beggiatoa sp.]
MIIKQSTINQIAVIAFCLMVFLLAGSVYFENQAIQEEHHTLTRQAEFKQLGLDLAEASHYLTDKTRYFVITAHITHLQDYWQEIEVIRTRENIITRIKALKVPQAELDLLTLAKQQSDALVATETRAMRLVLEAQAIPKTLMPPSVANWQLSAEENKLSAEDKMKGAREMMFDAQYDNKTRAITEPIAQFQKLMNARIAREVQAAHNKTEMTTLILAAMVFLILIGMGTVLWLFRMLFSDPIATYISALQNNEDQALDFTLTPAGTKELRLLADAFNQQFHIINQQHQENLLIIEDIVQVSQGLAEGHLQIRPQAQYRGEFVQIKTALEKTLISLRLVIEDIVQVSHGLAAGDLQVRPKAEYQGDFAQIKQALETTLSSLRQVIENIVQTSQGLATGQLREQPDTEYQGDFVQIKNALDSAATTLAKTTAHNTKQDWLKTGQTELNETMRGEQTLNTLTQNILNYLANYLNAQVGVFFLGEGEYFKLVSSYAYKQRNHNANALKLGEGLIGQAALEKKSILFCQIPKEHINMSIHSGLGESLPQDIFVLPLIYADQVLGVLELAAVRSFNASEIELLDLVADNIAITLNTAQSRLRMQALLEQSQQLTQTLQTQQQEVVEREERIRAIVDTVIDAIITIDERGIIESFNKSAEQIFGYAKSEAIGQNIKILMPDPHRSQHDQYLNNYFRTGNAKLIGQVREVVGQRKNGNDFPIEISIAEMQLNNQRLFTGIVRDITARKEAEQALQEQQEELRSTNEELQSQSEELQVQQEELRQTNEELEERTRELERQKEDIRDKHLALENSQQSLKTKAKELEQASQYKSEFLANMSHELRTPLNSLLILAKLLSENKSGNLTDKQVKYTQTIYSAGSDLLALINDILDLSKIEAGKMVLHLENLPLPILLDNLEQQFRHVAQEKGLDFKITADDDLPEVLRTDQQKLQQILNNMLSNAFKFTEKGEIKVAIRNASVHELTQNSLHGLETLKEQTVLAISVSDTGIGIPKEKQHILFQAFQQVDGSTNRRYGGTGLGLSISRQLALLFGGELHLESETGKGSTFTLYLPENAPTLQTDTAQPDPISIPQSTEEIKSLDTTKKSLDTTPAQPAAKTLEPLLDDRNTLQPTDKSVLIIEDDRQFSHILMEVAQESGFKCLIAEDGQTGLQLVEDYSPRAIILDIGLPQMDGLRVMEKLKEEPKTRHIPVHFMSAYNQPREAKKQGAMGYLHKPVNMDELSEAFKKIENFIAKKPKNILLVVDNQSRHKAILEIASGGEVQSTVAETLAQATQDLQKIQFDCIVVDIDVEKGTGIKLLESLRHDDNLSQIPIILYMARELTSTETQCLQECEKNLTIKTVRSQERLLDEATLFLHQLETNLPPDKRKMLKMVHDKEAILRQKKVLIVDDDMRNTFALLTLLEEKEVEVLVAENGKEALEMLEQHPDTHLVLMDIMMPEMDGYETMQSIRKQIRFRQLPIIALTAKAMAGDKAKCIEAGANDYLSKPVDTDKLISLMRVWLYQ